MHIITMSNTIMPNVMNTLVIPLQQKPLCAHPKHQIPWSNKTTWSDGSKGNWLMGGYGSKVVGSIGIKKNYSSTHKSMVKQ
jgi:hypothetical protein